MFYWRNMTTSKKHMMLHIGNVYTIEYKIKIFECNWWFHWWIQLLQTLTVYILKFRPVGLLTVKRKIWFQHVERDFSIGSFGFSQCLHNVSCTKCGKALERSLDWLASLTPPAADYSPKGFGTLQETAASTSHPHV